MREKKSLTRHSNAMESNLDMLCVYRSLQLELASY